MILYWTQLKVTFWCSINEQIVRFWLWPDDICSLPFNLQLISKQFLKNPKHSIWLTFFTYLFNKKSWKMIFVMIEFAKTYVHICTDADQFTLRANLTVTVYIQTSVNCSNYLEIEFSTTFFKVPSED